MLLLLYLRVEGGKLPGTPLARLNEETNSRSVVSKILKNFFSKKLKLIAFFLFHGQQGAPGHAEFV